MVQAVNCSARSLRLSVEVMCLSLIGSLLCAWLECRRIKHFLLKYLDVVFSTNHDYIFGGMIGRVSSFCSLALNLEVEYTTFAIL